MRRTLILMAALMVPFVFTACFATRNRVTGKKEDLSPYSFGLDSAKNGMERYQVLLNTHRAAVQAGVNVDYSGIDTIRLDIPEKPSRIPLTNHNDFKGCVFVVKNNANNTYLFDRNNEGKPIEINKRLIDAGDFRSVDSLKRGRCLLIIEDENLWVANRKGYNYGHTRKDILLIEKGVAKNAAIMPYNNAYSKPKFAFIRLSGEPLAVKNLTIERDPECTSLTHVTYITGMDDVRFSNVIIKTPDSPLTDDRCFSIYNCTNVIMEDVRIEGTYSHLDHSGYGINLRNVWNFKAKRLYGNAKWGIFGNRNVNKASIEDSQINRFDIHCYGKDISFKNVNFFNLYNQYSSVYGTISHEDCTFTNFIPVLNAGSYNSYVGYDVVFRNCVYNASAKNKYLIRMANLNDAANERHELAEKCLPNVSIKNLTINMTEGEGDFFIFYSKLASNDASSIGYLSNISIDGLTINADYENPVNCFSLSNVNIQTMSDVDCQMKNVTINQTKGVATKSSQGEAAVLKTNLPIKGGKVRMKNVINLKQR